MIETASSGHFFVLEGLDGSGQTTQANLLVGWLSGLESTQAIYTKEPTDGPIGSVLRRILKGEILRKDGEPIDETSMALLFAADRVDHLKSEIEPCLSQQTFVVCDRYVLSQLAYQSLQMDLDWLLSINEKALTPALTVFIDVPAEESFRRIVARGSNIERYESVETLQKVRESFLKAIAFLERHGYPIEVVDGTAPIAEIQQIVQGLVKNKIADVKTRIPLYGEPLDPDRGVSG